MPLKDQLRTAYQLAGEADVTRLRSLVQLATGRDTVVSVGSGGALALAAFAADLIAALTQRLARYMTPLELATTTSLSGSSVLVFSSRARHADTALAIRLATERQMTPVGLITQRIQADLGDMLSHASVVVVTVPTWSNREGFLATASTVGVATLLVRALDPALQLPSELPSVQLAIREPIQERALILSPPGLAAVAADMQIRLDETGLASVQTTDYRNFAHGRHLGLSRHLSDTTVIALTTPAHDGLVDATLRLLPKRTKIVRLESTLDWPICVVDLLCASALYVDATARARRFNASQPRVSEFGRKLYHLNVNRQIASKPDTPIERKLAGLGIWDQAARDACVAAYEEWSESIRKERFKGLVLDYDGTVCRTEDRFELPNQEVQRLIVRVLKAGLLIGFASGRGRSLHRDLRKWIPADLWPLVTLGLYNGGLITRLDEGVAVPAEDPTITEFGRLLENDPLLRNLKRETRAVQVTVIQPWPESNLPHFVDHLSGTIERGGLALKVIRSGHSVDVIPAAVSKSIVINQVMYAAKGLVIAIGDQGQVGGNDHELLDAIRWSLSVDQCSGAADRCWNIAPSGWRGPEALASYLSQLEVKTGSVSLRRQ